MFYSRKPFHLQGGHLHCRTVASAHINSEMRQLYRRTPPHSCPRGLRRAGGGSAALAQALEELHADGDAHVPAQRDEADVAGHDGRPQQVLH